MCLEQAVHGAARECAARHDAGGFEQQPDLAHGALGVLAFGGQHGGLHGLGQLRATGVDTGLAGQTVMSRAE
ncbi:hypothetical protein WI88_16115 [Burkholderia ubonensis]|nr:hypothetical protein WI88_16115 [Burkholderia ubonensis]